MDQRLLIDMYIPVEPFGKERPMFAKGKVITREKTRKCENDIGMIVKNHMQKHKIEMTKNPVRVESLFCFSPKVKKKGRGDPLHPTKPDLDNLQKLLYDALNKIAYEDDGQIIHSFASKKYADDNTLPGIYLKLYEYLIIS